MKKTQYIMLSFSILFFVVALFLVNKKTLGVDENQNSSSRTTIMELRLQAIKQAEESDQDEYSFSNQAPPPLI